MNSLKEKWEYISVHIWLLMSSYGIMYACLSFMEDMGIYNYKENYPGLWCISYSFRNNVLFNY